MNENNIKAIIARARYAQQRYEKQGSQERYDRAAAAVMLGRLWNLSATVTWRNWLLRLQVLATCQIRLSKTTERH